MPESLEYVNNKSAFFLGFLRVFKDHICAGFLWHANLGERGHGSAREHEIMKQSLMLMAKWPES